MASRLFGCNNGGRKTKSILGARAGCARQVLGALLAAYAALAGGCLSDGQTSPGSSSSSTAGTSLGGTTLSGTAASTTTPVANYQAALSVKVIFNKTGFYTNSEPNFAGCAGDARAWYDPQTDRQVPTPPLWLRNIGVDITNSNALNGPSITTSCGLTGQGSAPAANCANFDDLQPLNGLQSRSVLVGGYGCLNGIAGCTPTTILNDSWSLVIPDLNTGSTWTQQSTTLPTLNVNNAAGFVWSGGDFDSLHDEFFIFGGAVPGNSATNPSTEGVFSNSVVQFSFNSDMTISSNPAPTVLPATTRHFYAGWAKSGAFDTALNPYFPPPPMTGTTFTYAVRREPSMKSLCHNGDAGLAGFLSTGGATGNCTAASQPFGVAGIGDAAVSTNEDSDYLLLVGGMPHGAPISSQIYIYKPHGYSDDVGKGQLDTVVPAGGDWNLVSNATNAPGVLSQKVMSVVDLGPSPVTDVATTPYQGTLPGGARANGDTFNGWVGRAYHRTSYDPGMNRFYIYGGLESSGAESGSPQLATAEVPDVATSDVWIYDPPAIGRRPTSVCFTPETPDATSLPVSASTGPMGASLNLGASQNYVASKYVFPPGGCLQRIKLDGAMPPERFEHGQAFDPDLKRLYVFGGCNSPALVFDSNTAHAGDPTLGCNTGAALMNDLWMYVPPTITEIVPKTYATSTLGPFSSNPLQTFFNIFGTDFWLDHQPLFIAAGDPTSGTLSTPPPSAVLGGWVKLTPPASPFPRVSASMSFDRSHHKIYLQGGWGCSDPNCAAAPQALNDLWEYVPPLATDCAFSTIDGVLQCGDGSGSGQGTWTQIQPILDASNSAQPTERYGALMSFANTQFTGGDEFYTVTDNACEFEGPISSADASVNKQYVGAIYVDIDRTQIPANSNLLISLRYLPYDNTTRLPGYTTNGVTGVLADETDVAGSTDQAMVRVQLLNDTLQSAQAIESSTQPRYHEFVAGTPVIGDTFMYVAAPTGQVSERQIYVPLEIDPTINLIKIERIQGSMKFYELTVTVL